MLAGKPPYDAKTASTFSIYKKIDSEPLAELSNFELNAIVQKATAKDKSKRFSNCTDFLNSFGNEETIIEQPKPELPVPPPIPQPEPKPEPLPQSNPPATSNEVESLSWFGYFIKSFKNYANFKGRARRKEFWSFFLFHLIFTLFAFLIGGFGGGSDETAIIGLMIYTIASLLPYFAVSVRRIHDTGKSGWFILIPYYNIYLYVIKGEKEKNKYGQNPKGQ